MSSSRSCRSALATGPALPSPIACPSHWTTGATFTEFVSRTRIERAKNLLLNPNLRISEIAYEIGFQSLTHFNRVFRKIVGESPTDYRGHLPKAG